MFFTAYNNKILITSHTQFTSVLTTKGIPNPYGQVYKCTHDQRVTKSIWTSLQVYSRPKGYRIHIDAISTSLQRSISEYYTTLFAFLLKISHLGTLHVLQL